MSEFTPQNIPIRKPGDPLLTAQENNALIRAARKQYDVRKGISDDGALFAAKDSLSPEETLKVIATEAIPAYSVFTIQNTGDSFSLEDPTSHSKQYSGTDLIILCNDDIAMIADGVYFIDPINPVIPRIVKYDSADGVPTIGEALGPKPSSYLASKDGTGLVAVSEPDTTNERVWVLATGGGSSLTLKRGRLVSNINPGSSGVVRIYDIAGETGATEIAFNPYTIVLRENEFVWLRPTEGWALSHAVPDQYAECPP